MRRRRTIVVAFALAAFAVASPLACNSITGITDYGTQTCDVCLTSSCSKVIGQCHEDSLCKPFLDCIQSKCSPESNDLRSCFASCQKLAPPSAVAPVLGCTVASCRPYCLGGALPIDAQDAAVDGTFDTPPTDAPPADGDDATPVDSSPVDSGDGAPFDAGGITPGPPMNPSNCTTATRGPTMVVIATKTGVGDYCIDTTEVTMGQYWDFWKAAADGRATAGQRLECSFNTDFTPQYPSPGWSDPSKSGLAKAPVRYVDWCDASAFCFWAGKRLCGAVGGGSTTWGADGNDADKDQWFGACTNGGASDYPYGATYTPGNCNDSDGAGGGPRNVGSSLACKGTGSPYDAIFDMSGNVAEWEDSCDVAGGSTGGLTNCRTRGGNYAGVGSLGTAACSVSTFQHRAVTTSLLGFRCCTH